MPTIDPQYVTSLSRIETNGTTARRMLAGHDLACPQSSRFPAARTQSPNRTQTDHVDTITSQNTRATTQRPLALPLRHCPAP